MVVVVTHEGGGHLPGFKDLHLPNVCISSVLVVRQDADLKEKGFHWSVSDQTELSVIFVLLFPYVPSLFVISMSTHSSGSSNSKTVICFTFCHFK